ncbi:MAG: nitrate/sulfonate/bicarbonate ABC transporter ATP-binding protein [Pirellulaceae bacterium]|nr:MAG: nitrate/sulfonate/bicarbonate ABC transporter ATP-binding protein [Pirellulaceae bacterium]
MMLSRISLQDVVVRFGDHPPVLDSLSLDLAPEKIVSVIGPSGCGKTTLLRTIAGLVEPQEGRVRTVTSAGGGAGLEVGVVFQEPALLPWRTVWENVRLPLELRGRGGRAAVDDEVARQLSAVHLAQADWGKLPRQLSGGMRMRVSLARALVTNPSMLLLDEPFAALDDMLRAQMNQLVLELWQTRRRTTLLVTHNLAEAVLMSHRIVIMVKGRLVADVDNPLPWPRSLDSRAGTQFAEVYQRISELLWTAAEAEVKR